MIAVIQHIKIKSDVFIFGNDSNRMHNFHQLPGAASLTLLINKTCIKRFAQVMKLGDLSLVTRTQFPYL